MWILSWKAFLTLQYHSLLTRLAISLDEKTQCCLLAISFNVTWWGKKLQFFTRTAWAGQGAKTNMRQTFSPDDVKPEVKVSWLKNSTVLSIYNFDEWRWHPWWWKQPSKLITRRPRLQSDQDDDDDQPICFWWWLLVKYKSVWQKHHKTGFKLMDTLQSGCVIEILTLCRMIFF